MRGPMMSIVTSTMRKWATAAGMRLKLSKEEIVVLCVGQAGASTNAQAATASLLAKLKEFQRAGAADRLRATRHTQFAKDIVDVFFYRADGNHQFISNSLIGVASFQQAEHFEFSFA